jgi:hypothetical protein
MNAERPSLAETFAKTVVVAHTLTYFFVGVLAFVALEYSILYSEPSVASFVRETSDPLVTAGPLFQPIRGFLFGLLFYFLRDPFFRKPNGWLLLWATLAVLGILGPFVAAPGPLEGLVYTRLPLSFQLLSLPEVVIQTLLFSGLLFYWIRNPQRRWLTWVLGVVFALVILFPALGLLVRQPR